MACVVVSLIGDFVEDVGEIAMQGCVSPTEAGTLEVGETTAAHKVAAEIDSIADSKGREQILEHPESNKLQIQLRGSRLTEGDGPIHQ